MQLGFQPAQCWNDSIGGVHSSQENARDRTDDGHYCLDNCHAGKRLSILNTFVGCLFIKSGQKSPEINRGF